MKIAWKKRLTNKATLVAIIAGVVALVYQVLGWCGVIPQISQEEVINAGGTLVNLLVLLGIVVDPTTEGISDSDRVLNGEQNEDDNGYDKEAK